MSEAVESERVSLTVAGEGRAVEIENEIEIQYYTAGSEDQEAPHPPLVLLHGIGLDAAGVSFRHFIPSIADERRVIAFDFPGHGKSEKPDVRYTTAFYREVFERFLDTLEVERADLMGTSMGGCVALGHALDAPEMVRKLVLVNSYGLGSDAPWRAPASITLRWPWADRVLWNAMTGTRAAIRTSLRGLVGRTVPDDLVEDIYRIVQQPNVGRAQTSWQRSEFRLSGLKTNHAPQLPTLAVPTLFVHGASDPLLPANWSVRAARKCPTATLELIDECGHWMPRERPKLFNRVVKRFIGKD